MPEVCRWVIDGVLAAESYISIGSGIKKEGLIERGPNRTAQPFVDIVARDGNGNPYIPGTALKGSISSWLKRRQKNSFGDYVSLFGSSDRSGDFVFQNAYLDELGPGSHGSSKFTMTIKPRVALNRDTKTASDAMLAHREYVDPKTRFKVRIIGSFRVKDGRDGQKEVDKLLGLLEKYNDKKDRITLGSGSGSGAGRVTWECTSVKMAGKAEISAWLEAAGKGKESCWQDHASVYDFRNASKDSINGGDTQIGVFNLKIEFNGQFLVKDAAKSKKENGENIADSEKEPDYSPRLTVDGKVLLPGTSFLGAIRSQAERILRTISGDPAKAACYVTSKDSKKKCPPVKSKSDLEKLCVACQIFGASGWKSPVSATDFISEKIASTRVQDFVAIDRFTGGGVEKKKFNIRYAYKPVMIGSIILDVERLKLVPAGTGAQALMSLLFRDILEGDITFGFGASKGYGQCKAKITQDSTAAKEWIDNIAEKNEALKTSFESLDVLLRAKC